MLIGSVSFVSGRDMLGTDMIVTPVRRSVRKTKRPTNLEEKSLTINHLSELPATADFAYVPNNALKSNVKRETRVTPMTPQPVKVEKEFNMERLAQTAVKQRKTHLRQIVVKESDDEEEDGTH